MNAPGTSPVGPPASAELKTPDELAALGFKSAGRIRRHLVDGSLHGHRYRDIPKARWEVPLAVAWAWRAGQSPDAQRAACPLCAQLAGVTPIRRGGAA